jgi:phospholipid/cholesterol/gamma-HCH transport system ATP-binding protein
VVGHRQGLVHVVIADGRIVFDGEPAALQASDDPLLRQFLDGQADGPIPFDARPLDARTDVQATMAETG